MAAVGGGQSIPERFGQATRSWFSAEFASPTPVQARGWEPIGAGRHTLMLAPTGSGKTLAAFLSCIDTLAHQPRAPGYRVLYLSPIKALAYDIERNLNVPLAGIAAAAAAAGVDFEPIAVDVRTGDTPAAQRRRHLRDPGDILITTPESLFLLLGGAARETLRDVQTVIVDEIHALAPNKRGAHLALSLERLSVLCHTDPQRIGLSATQRPLEEMARYLGGDRPVSIVDASEPPNLQLQITVPVADMQQPLARNERGDPAAHVSGVEQAPAPEERHSIWPAIYPQVLSLVQHHTSTLVFVNSRRLAERVAQGINALAEQELVQAHHGSMAREQRVQIEDLLKQGKLRGIVATSSLELGIDMGALDLVVQIESPKSAARGLQRLGRAGHSVGQTSKGRLFPKFRGDLLETTVVVQRILAGDVEPVRIPRNALDVLAQQIVAICAEEACGVDALEQLVRRAYGYANLSRRALESVLDMLSGRFPSDAFADFRARIDWNRVEDTIQGRRGAKMLSLINAGTIADRGTYGVYLGGQGPKLGDLDEEMVYESRVGEVFLLGASSWRIEEITRERVVVSPAPGMPGRMPFWRGDSLGRSLELGRSLGAFVRQLGAMPESQALDWLTQTHHLDALAARNLIGYVAEQREATGVVPSDRQIVIERSMDELGDWRVCILSPFGARIHAPWALVLQAQFAEEGGFDVQTLWSDDGIVLSFANSDGVPNASDLVPDPELLEQRLTEQLARSAVFASHFRENAARALLLPRRQAKARRPLWTQRIRSQQLMAAAMGFADFPIVLETYREVLQDVFDLPALTGLLEAIRRREVGVTEVETLSPSPFSRSLIFDYVATYMYEGDAPLAERRAQALTLDRRMLRELMGQEALQELLDAEVIATVDAELQYLHEDCRCDSDEALHDMLRRLGDLTLAEITQRCTEDPRPWLASLEAGQQVALVGLGNEQRYISLQDAGRYRDALGVVPPEATPAAFLEPTSDALDHLLLRWARYRGPFVDAELSDRFGLTAELVDGVLGRLEQQGLLLRDTFTSPAERGAAPQAEAREAGQQHCGQQWCHTEVLRRIKRRTLAKYRGEIEPVEPTVYARFVPQWQGVGASRGAAPDGLSALREAIKQLQGVPIAFSELEQRVLPARVRDYHPRLLDELGAMGEVVWVGRAPLAGKDGRVVLYRREDVGHLLESSGDADLDRSAVHRMAHDHLQAHGASFVTMIQAACGDVPVTEVLAAIWDLVWSGLVTNDTFVPLRALGHPKSHRRGRGPSLGGGRWSCVQQMVPSRPHDTARLHARAVLLLQRYGVVTREAAAAEGLTGGFGPLARVLRAMEDAGKVRRGYFVDGLGGMQFAHRGAVDRLRSLREDAADAVSVLSAVDPANVYGTLLPWPSTHAGAGRPARRSGALVVSLGGRAIFYWATRSRKLTTFTDVDPADFQCALARSVGDILRMGRARSLRVDEVDGEPSTSSALSTELVAAGFRREYMSMVFEQVPQRVCSTP